MRRLAVFVALAATLAGCGRVGFDPTAALGDGPAAGDGPPAATCTSWGPFGPAVRLSVSFSKSDNWVPRVSRDDLRLYFDGFNGANFDVMISTRASPADDFPDPTLLTDVSSQGDDDQGAQEGATTGAIYVQRDNGDDFELFEFPRLGSMFGTPRRHDTLIGARHVWVSDDELRIYFIRDGFLRRSARATTAELFGEQVSLMSLDLAVGDDNGSTLALTPDELELFVGAERADTIGRLDLYRAVRTDAALPFGALEPLDTLNTVFDDLVGSISTDGSTLYVNLDTDVDGGRAAQIGAAKRTCND